MPALNEQNLPDWDLDHLYEGPKSDALKADLEEATRQAKGFAAAYTGKLADLDGLAFGNAISEFESISEILQRIMSYGQLLFATHTSDADVGQFYQTLQEQVTDISTDTLFFALEINRLDDDNLDAKLQNEATGLYKP